MSQFFSIIIPTYNRSRLLAATLESFIALDYPAERYEIIVADNASTDDTAQVIDSYVARYPFVKRYFERRQGVHFARNSAAKTAVGEILYFTDDDVIADPGLLRGLAELFERYPEVGSATGKILGKFEVEPPAWVRRDLVNGLLSLTETGRPDGVTVSERNMVYSCHQAVRREVFFRCGGFNPENTAGVWIGDGESGLAIKIRAAGYLFAYNSASLIYHVIPRTRMTLGYLLKRFGNQGYCDSYTEYRGHRSRKGIVAGMLQRNCRELWSTLFHNGVAVLQGRRSWRFLPAYCNYHLRRNLYDLKLLCDAEFRAMVEVDDWLDEKNAAFWYENILLRWG